MLAVSDRDLAIGWVLDKLAAAKKTGGGMATVAKEVQTAEEKKKDLGIRQSKEVVLWHTWNNNGRKPKDLDPLLKSFAPLIQKRVNIYKNRVEIPVAAIEHEHKKWFVEAMKDWKPEKGALNTWATWKLKRAGRFIESNKNFARISENISQHIGAFNAVKSELKDKLGHEPDDQSVHDHILENGHPTLGKLSLKDIKRINKEQRRGLIQSGHDVEEMGGAPNLSSREEEVVHLIYHQLTPLERVVHEYTFGLNGKPKLSPGQIAKKLDMDNSKVSKLRTAIYKKIEPNLGL